MNAVLLAVILMLVLAVCRVHVVIALFIGALVGGLVGGLGLDGTMLSFQEGLTGGAQIALSYALLGAFAMAVAHTGLPDALARWMIARLDAASPDSSSRTHRVTKWALIGAILLMAIMSQNLIPVHIAFIPLLIPPLLTVFNRLHLDRRAISTTLTFGLVTTYMFIPVGFGNIFLNDILLSAPSILIGLFVYQLVVLPMGGFSGWAGVFALAIIVIPVVVRTTEDMLQLIPNTLREAVIALGAPKWKMIVLVCYRAALSGILTGVLLAVARIAGETAPLLLTSFGNAVMSFDLGEAMASLPIAIYQQANSGFPDLIAIAWSGALLVTLGVLAINIAARVLLRKRR